MRRRPAFDLCCALPQPPGVIERRHFSYSRCALRTYVVFSFVVLDTGYLLILPTISTFVLSVVLMRLA